MSGNEWLAVGDHPLAAVGFRNILYAAMHYRNYSKNDMMDQLPESAPALSVVRALCINVSIFKFW